MSSLKTLPNEASHLRGGPSKSGGEAFHIHLTLACRVALVGLIAFGFGQLPRRLEDLRACGHSSASGLGPVVLRRHAAFEVAEASGAARQQVVHDAQAARAAAFLGRGRQGLGSFRRQQQKTSADKGRREAKKETCAGAEWPPQTVGWPTHLRRLRAMRPIIRPCCDC